MLSDFPFKTKFRRNSGTFVRYARSLYMVAFAADKKSVKSDKNNRENQVFLNMRLMW